MLKPLCLLLSSLPIAGFAVITNQRVDLAEAEYHLHTDNTYQLTYTEKRTLLTPLGVKEGQNTTINYFPDKQSLKLISAYVILPSGKKVPITKDNYFVRPSAAAQEAPGFTDSMTMTVLFPQVQPGSQTFIQWQLTQKTPDLFGVNIVDVPELKAAITKEQLIIHMPKNYVLHWGVYGDYKVTEQSNAQEKTLIATFGNKPAQAEEDFMPSESDVEPVFAASSLASWQELGNIYWKNEQDKAAVTPQIAELAKKIVGDKTGQAAVQALYNWVAINIEYVAIYLNDAAGYVPHAAQEVLNNGYGDCKDHVVLLQALLKAVGIDSYPALVSWDNSYRTMPIPTSNQFNHVLIYIPSLHQFANPTNYYSAFGNLDVFAANKFVVIASPNSSTGKTPVNTPANNRYTLHNQIKIDANGGLTGHNVLNFEGSFNEDARHLVGTSPSLNQLTNQLLSTTLAGGTGTMTASDVTNLNQDMTIKNNWTSLHAINMQNSTYFIPPIGPDFYNPQLIRSFVTTVNRIFPIILNAGTLAWHSDITLPDLQQITHLPKNMEFNNSAGSYSSIYDTAGDVLHISRKLTINQSYYSPAQYPALQDLLYKVIMDTQSVLVMQTKS